MEHLYFLAKYKVGLYIKNEADLCIELQITISM